MKTYGLLISWLICLFGMLITLYMSYQLNYPVCTMCWYQRIALYPLVIILGIAAFKNDSNGIRYALPFPIIGFFFALYQYLEQMIPGFAPIELCTQHSPQCSQIHLLWLGFITIPFLSMVMNLLIAGVLILTKKTVCTKKVS